MKPDDQAILVTHQPMWLQEWFKEKMGCHNLRQLVRCHLRGRARIHLAGMFTIQLPSGLTCAAQMAHTQCSSSGTLPVASDASGHPSEHTLMLAGLLSLKFAGVIYLRTNGVCCLLQKVSMGG